MGKSTRLLKRLVALSLVLLFSIESFAALVGDNDGAAFITKAEFDSLKNTFQAEIDRYNSSLDNKIDGAIAHYVAGVRVTTNQLLTNKYNSIELMTGQKLSNLKWSKATDFTVNACSRESGTKDYQKMWQSGTLWVMHGADDNVTGVKGTIKFYDYTAANTTEQRIELDKNNRIIAWGNYNIGFELVNAQVKAYGRTGNGLGIWVPVQFDTFQNTVRRPWLWRINNDHNCENNTGYAETSGAKCQETLPQDAETFNFDKFLIAPLSAKNEAFLPPRPLVGDTSTWTGVSGSDNSYGEKVIRYSAQNFIQGTTANVAKYHITTTATQPGTAPIVWTDTQSVFRVYEDLEARFFRIKKFNDVGFKAIYDNWSFDCPIKCGVPMVDSRTYKSEDKILVTVEAAASNGYLIPYVTKNPSDTWNGAKSNYAIDKYKITANVKKTITIDLDSAGDKVVFVVWLPDTPCVLPTLKIYHQS